MIRSTARNVGTRGSLASATVALLLLCCIAVATGAASSGRETETGVTPNSVLVGNSSSVTGSIGSVCSQAVDGARAYLAKVNKQGGVAGRKLKFVSLDDAGDPVQGVANVHKLIEETGVFSLFGGCGTSGNIATLPLIESVKIPQVFPLSSTRLIGVTYSTLFKLTPTADQQTALITRWAFDKFGKGTVAIVENAGASKYNPAAVNWAAGPGQSPIVSDVSLPFSQTDFGSIVINLRQANPDYVLLAIGTVQAGQLLNEMKVQGFKPKKYILSQYATADPSFLRGAGDSANGRIFMTSPVVTPNDPIAQQCPLPKGQERGLYNTLGCAAGKALALALKQTGKDLTRTRLMDTLKSWKNVNLGLTPRLTYHAENGLMLRGLYIWRVNNKGQFERVTKRVVTLANDRNWVK
jgi:branched-chain amino acid transport system substrate-binding protein